MENVKITQLVILPPEGVCKTAAARVQGAGCGGTFTSSKSFPPHCPLSKGGCYKQQAIPYWPSPFHSGLSIDTNFL